MRRRLAAFVAALLVVVGIEWLGARVLNPYIYRVLVLCGLNAILALSLNLVN